MCQVACRQKKQQLAYSLCVCRFLSLSRRLVFALLLFFAIFFLDASSYDRKNDIRRRRTVDECPTGRITMNLRRVSIIFIYI